MWKLTTPHFFLLKRNHRRYSIKGRWPGKDKAATTPGPPGGFVPKWWKQNEKHWQTGKWCENDQFLFMIKLWCLFFPDHMLPAYKIANNCMILNIKDLVQWTQKCSTEPNWELHVVHVWVEIRQLCKGLFDQMSCFYDEISVASDLKTGAHLFKMDCLFETYHIHFCSIFIEMGIVLKKRGWRSVVEYNLSDQLIFLHLPRLSQGRCVLSTWIRSWFSD